MAEPIVDDEDPSTPVWRILAFPALGRSQADGVWRIELEGVIYQRGGLGLRKRMMLRVLRRFMNIDPAQLDPQLFGSRVEAFVGNTDRGWKPEIRLGRGEFEAARGTRSNGRFASVVRCSPSEQATLLDLSHNAARPQWEVRLQGEERAPTVAAPVFLIPEYGLSVVSDIDDTIKHTEVRQRREMLLNTFARPFAAVAGMAQAFRELASGEAAFHYVSSSPWQLFAPLSELLVQAEFPAGTIHLRNFQIRDHMLRRMFLLHRRGKGGVIAHLLESFPCRRFLLVGDSGERDPKIYAKLALRHPEQVEAVLIRVLADEHRKPLLDRFNRSPILSSKLLMFSTAEEFSAICRDRWPNAQKYRAPE